MATPLEISTNSAPDSNPGGSAGSPMRKSQKKGFRVLEFLFMCIVHWPWFVASVVVCMSLAFIYIKKTTPIYQKSASILLKTDSQGRSSGVGSSFFEDAGLTKTNSYIFDEIQVLKSPDIMRDVVRNLNLNITYTTRGKFRTIGLYGDNLPVEVMLPDLQETDDASFALELERNGDFKITDITLRGKALERAPIHGQLGQTVVSPIGRIMVNPAPKYKGNAAYEIKVHHSTVRDAAAGFSSALKVEADEKAWTLVTMTLTDWSPERACDVLNQLIASYSENWMLDKRKVADNTSKFIDERVQLLQQELGSVDSDISSFKSANLVPDINAAATLAMNQASQASIALKDLRNQEYMAKYIRNYLRNSDNINKLLPTSTAFSSPSLSGSIAQYNTKILERNSLVAQSSSSNPLVAQIDMELNALKAAVLASVDNELVAISEQIKSQEGLTGHAKSQIASNPQQAKYLLSVERQQKVKESLYLYLLQKREENQLDQAYMSYNTRTVREADGPGGPIAPLKSNIMIISLLIGLSLPALYIFQQEMSVHVVRGRKDLADMKIPMVGELPLHSKKQKLPSAKLATKDPKPVVAVRENSRNSINEAFRVLRTNLEFMHSDNTSSKVVMLTSFNPGSGKTFVSYNLAKSFAIKGDRVIVLDLDMRKSAVSKYVKDAKEGIADYLVHRVDDVKSLIVTDEQLPNLSVLPVGTTPPNPTELLFNERLDLLIKDLRQHYDYIFIDCPPVEVVADSTIISKYADYTLFVIRAGLLDLSMLEIIDDMYEKGSYPSMSLVLNGTINPHNTYSRMYGNPYSYGYGYGSNYSYSSED